MKQVKSVAYYLLHNTGDKTYNRVLKASREYPDASLYELQHGVNSKASQKYRTRHVPEIDRGYDFEAEEFEPEYLPEPPEEKLTIFCYRDYLGGARGMYYGVNLYFAETHELDFFEAVREHFADELTTAMIAMDYEKNPISTCEVDEIGTTGNIKDQDFIFEISNIKKNTFQYYGHWQDGRWTVFEMFGDFDDIELNRLLRKRY
jgi:hypothetical protein